MAERSHHEEPIAHCSELGGIGRRRAITERRVRPVLLSGQTLAPNGRVRGGHSSPTTVTGGTVPAAKQDPTLVKALRAAHAMVDRDAAGLPVLAAAPATPWRRRLVRLAFLAPALQRAVLDGTQPTGLTLPDLMNAPPALLWSEQVDHFGIEMGA